MVIAAVYRTDQVVRVGGGVAQIAVNLIPAGRVVPALPADGHRRAVLIGFRIGILRHRRRFHHIGYQIADNRDSIAVLAPAQRRVPGHQVPVKAVAALILARDLHNFTRAGDGCGIGNALARPACRAAACADGQSARTGARLGGDTVGQAGGQGGACRLGHGQLGGTAAITGRNARALCRRRVCAEFRHAGAVAAGHAGRIGNDILPDHIAARTCCNRIILLHGHHHIGRLLRRADMHIEFVPIRVPRGIVVYDDRRAEQDHLVFVRAGIEGHLGFIGRVHRILFIPLRFIGSFHLHAGHCYAKNREILLKAEIGACGCGSGLAGAGAGTRTQAKAGRTRVVGILLPQVAEIRAGLQDRHDLRVGVGIFLALVLGHHAVVGIRVCCHQAQRIVPPALRDIGQLVCSLKAARISAQAAAAAAGRLIAEAADAEIVSVRSAFEGEQYLLSSLGIAIEIANHRPAHPIAGAEQAINIVVHIKHPDRAVIRIILVYLAAGDDIFRCSKAVKRGQCQRLRRKGSVIRPEADPVPLLLVPQHIADNPPLPVRPYGICTIFTLRNDCQHHRSGNQILVIALAIAAAAKGDDFHIAVAVNVAGLAGSGAQVIRSGMLAGLFGGLDTGHLLRIGLAPCAVILIHDDQH